MSCSKWLLRYLSDTLVETGSGMGGGISDAIKFGFKEIHSIEIDPYRHQYCVQRFKNNPEVHLYCGDSLDCLPAILKKVNGKATFLLDAHVMSFQDVHSNKIICPVIDELKMILNHGESLGLKHFILIDDVKYMDGKTETFGNISREDIKKIVEECSPTYKVTYYRRYISVI